ncbi:MAG: hypothetical protein AMJ75_02210 [Phycisphaerae bacterium SM1_79]|nr:MAG: hypothetical protein AMJ75_02210 [Phycisphaerae bacterium SM1_79]
MGNVKRSTAEKIRVFKGLFTGLTNVYGTYDVNTGRVRQVKEPVTDRVIHAHLAGRQSYGVYLLTGDRTGALAVDFDEDELCLPISFVAGARRYDIPAYIERSKSKGYHVWVFFENGGVLAAKARLVAQKILVDMGKPTTEVFPKQDALADGVSYGNFIHAPLFGAIVPKGRAVFVDPAEPTNVYPNQWELLARVQRVPELRLDAVIRSCNLEPQEPAENGPRPNSRNESDDSTSPFGLPPCARRMLAEGVTSFQRVSCFRLAVHLKRYGLPYDLALVALEAWAKKNRPEDGKRIITDAEITYQAKCAFESSYRSFGCEEPAIAAYCDKDCPLYAYTVGKSSV